MNNSRAEQAFNNFSNALERLEDALEMPLNADTRDIAILRFMLTYEASWKALKWILKEEVGINTTGPKPALQEAYQQEWLGEDDEVWLNMAEDRNLVVHTYSEEQAQEIYEHIKNYALAMRQAHGLITKTYPKLLDQ